MFLLDAEGLTALPAGAFQIDPRLTAATGTSFPVDESVSWKGSGAAFSEKEHLQFKWPGFVENENVDATFRNVNASRSFSFGGTNLTLNSFFADMQSAIEDDRSVSY